MSIDLKKSYGDLYSVPGDGLYICRFLDNASTINLVNFVHKFGITRISPEEANELHCTIVHSQVKPEVPCAPVFSPAVAHISGFEHWPGHDNTGYLVATLESKMLQQLHAYWHSLGCQYDFADYRPHITLKHPCSAVHYNPTAVVMASRELQRKPMTLRLIRESMYELKPRDE